MKFIVKVIFICFFYFLNATTRKFLITFTMCIVFLLNSVVLDFVYAHIHAYLLYRTILFYSLWISFQASIYRSTLFLLIAVALRIRVAKI